MTATVIVRMMRVEGNGSEYPFSVDCVTGVATLDAGQAVTVRPLLWAQKRALARFASLGDLYQRDEFARICVSPTNDDSAREAALALALWINAPEDGPLPLETALLARVTRDVCRSWGLTAVDLDARPAPEVESLWRHSGEPVPAVSTPDDGITRIIVVPDAESAALTHRESPAGPTAAVVEPPIESRRFRLRLPDVEPPGRLLGDRYEGVGSASVHRQEPFGPRQKDRPEKRYGSETARTDLTGAPERSRAPTAYAELTAVPDSTGPLSRPTIEDERQTRTQAATEPRFPTRRARTREVAPLSVAASPVDVASAPLRASVAAGRDASVTAVDTGSWPWSISGFAPSIDTPPARPAPIGAAFAASTDQVREAAIARVIGAVTRSATPQPSSTVDARDAADDASDRFAERLEIAAGELGLMAEA